MKENRSLLPLLQMNGYDCLHTVINNGSEISSACILFLRVMLRCSVIRCCISQELGSVLFSTAWYDYNTFGHCGAPLMGVYTQLRSAPEMQLHVSDKYQLRGLSSEEELTEHLSEESPKVPNHEARHILLCSCCQGRGEIWVRGIPFGHSINSTLDGQWVNTGLYGLWRDDGGMEILDV